MNVLLALTASITSVSSRAQMDLQAKQAWDAMLTAKYASHPRPVVFVVVEQAGSGQTLSYAHKDHVGWWMCFDDRPSPAGARVEVVNLASAMAGLTWIHHGPQPSRSISTEANQEQRMTTLAIFDPGSPELQAVPVSMATTQTGHALTVRSGRFTVGYTFEGQSAMPVSIELRVPYHKLFPSSPDREPNATTDTNIVLGSYNSNNGWQQPSVVLLRGVKYAVKVHTDVVLPDYLFTLPIQQAAQNADAWKSTNTSALPSGSATQVR